jgi:predicted dehydrogenase
MSPIRLGVIGCGNVLSAYRTVIDKLRARGAVEVALTCGREAQRNAAGEKIGSRETAGIVVALMSVVALSFEKPAARYSTI